MPAGSAELDQGSLPVVHFLSLFDVSFEGLILFSSMYVTFVPKSGRCMVKSVESSAGFPYPKYAIVIPGASSVVTWCLSFF